MPARFSSSSILAKAFFRLVKASSQVLVPVNDRRGFSRQHAPLQRRSDRRRSGTSVGRPPAARERRAWLVRRRGSGSWRGSRVDLAVAGGAGVAGAGVSGAAGDGRRRRRRAGAAAGGTERLTARADRRRLCQGQDGARARTRKVEREPHEETPHPNQEGIMRGSIGGVCARSRGWSWHKLA